MNLEAVQQYITLAIGIVTLVTLLGATTPKGMSKVLTGWNWLQQHVLFTHQYAEIHRIDLHNEAQDLRLDALEDLDK